MTLRLAASLLSSVVGLLAEEARHSPSRRLVLLAQEADTLAARVRALQQADSAQVAH